MWACCSRGDGAIAATHPAAARSAPGRHSSGRRRPTLRGRVPEAPSQPGFTPQLSVSAEWMRGNKVSGHANPGWARRPPAARCAFEAPSAFPRRTAPHLPNVPRQGAAPKTTPERARAPTLNNRAWRAPPLIPSPPPPSRCSCSSGAARQGRPCASSLQPQTLPAPCCWAPHGKPPRTLIRSTRLTRSSMARCRRRRAHLKRRKWRPPTTLPA